MVRGPRKHLKRLNAPRSWMLDKLGGAFAPRSRCGPHQLTASLPLCLIIRRKLSFAKNTKEIDYILRSRMVKVDGKPRLDKKYPAGFMDVISIPKIKSHYRLLYNVKRKFCLKQITEEESKFKLCKVVAKRMENKGILTIHTGDGRTIKYADPDIKIGDTIKFNLDTQEMEEFYSFGTGMTGYAFRGKNMGCVGIIREIKSHVSGFLMLNMEDLNGRMFITRADNVMVIGQNGESLISLPDDMGIKPSKMVESNLVYGEIMEDGGENEDLSLSSEDESDLSSIDE
ncbi:small subunit ribosomal protein S4e [Nematocida homosporus]|uniref:small subunit ribosomal protein S4e n=1 Tax=Nematocida homosporus TaxID=1912981 RepID=UPI00221E877F|nr:small subunit ribosomal protein S4e [Nematocida homosporus]KAI5184584.1 small subunit ribosomal protein S4e [Nematocida homosporus]